MKRFLAFSFLVLASFVGLLVLARPASADVVNGYVRKAGDYMSGTLQSLVASGKDAFSVKVRGARFRIGTGTNSYLEEDSSARIHSPTSFASDGSFLTGGGNFTALNAAVNFLDVNSYKAPFVAPAATAAQIIQFGSVALSGGTASVTFASAGVAFGAAPNCQCTDTAATAAAANCNGASTTTLTVKGSGTDTINWFCIGQR